MLKNIRFLAAPLLLLCAAPAWSAGTDELWEMTVSMEMGGMSMPASATNSCIPKGGSYKPEDNQHEKNCQISDYKVSGHKVSWKMNCTGKDAMSGSGEVTKTANSMKGVINISSHDMQMTQVINGKLVGTCDATAERKKLEKTVADIKQRSEETTKQICEDSVTRDAESGGFGQTGSSMYHGKQMCTAYQPQLCKKARAYAGTYKGYVAYASNRDSPSAKLQSWGWVLSECRIDLDNKRASLCKQALTDKAYRFIGGQCPAEAQALSGKECADFGMSLSPDMTKPNAGMCLALRSKGTAGGEPGQVDDAGAGSTGNNGGQAEAKPDDRKSDQAQDTAAGKTKGGDNPAAQALDAVKKLKGMFGF